MNGTGTRRSYGMEPAPLSPFRDVRPSDRAMVNGYREEVMDGFERRPKYNPLNVDRPQSSPLVDLKDPIQVHLLTETALADSREWEILSQEEVDGLKKQCLSLTQRIEQTRANLAIQSKYRDAAISMTKLYSPSQAGKRRSILGNRGSGGEAVREAEAERAACERRCEELASELFSLEKRIMEPQRQLLQHTAGILQLTHKATSKRLATPANAQLANGIPGSPESLYTYSNGRESVELTSSADGLLDERGLYLPIGLEQQMSGQTGGQQQQLKTKSIEIPQKSPIRQETKELRDETTRLQTECAQLQASNDSLSIELNALQRESSEQQQIVANAERQMGYLNGRLREVVVRFNPERHANYQTPPPGDSKVGAGLAGQLQYLDDTLQAVQDEQEQSLSLSASAGQAKSESGALFRQIEERMAATNGQIQEILSTAGGGGDGELAPVPAMSGTEAEAEAGVDKQLDWLHEALPVLETGVARAGDVSSAWQTERQAAERVNTVLSGLWEIMQSGLIEMQRKRAERQALRVQRGLAADDGGEDDVSGDESPMGVGEPYSLEAFSAEVQWLYEQTTKLREHKSVLKRQVKQQRELNNKSDAEKDEELRSKAAELEEAQQAAEAAQDELARALTDLSEMQQELLQRDVTTAAAGEGVQEKLAERESRVAALEARGVELQQELAAAQADVAGLAAQLQEAASAEQAARQAEQAARETAEQQAQQAQEAQEAARLATQQAQQAQEAQQAQQAQQQAQQVQMAQMTQQSQQSQKAIQQAEEATQQLQEQLQQQLRQQQQQLQEREQQLQQAQEATEQAEREAQGKDEELERLNAMVVELKTEATIAKAELDGAYGSRRQRAADVAALAKSSADEALQEQLAGLKEELAGTLKEYEDLTRDSVAAEREKVELEGQLDEALAARAALEAEARTMRDKLDAEVTALKEQLDDERLKVGSGAGAGGSGGGGGTRAGAGAAMLSEQFRATMKEERKKFQEEMRSEQAQRRKLEEEIRALKRAAKPGKSPLSPRQ